MRILGITFVIFLTLSLSTKFVRAEQEEDVEEAEEEVYSSSEIEVCSDSVIEVQDVSVVCDSPGTYYYGSGKYRNSATCLPGDKSKVEVDFYIADPDTIQNAGNVALLTLEVNSGGWFSTSKSVYENADLCSLSSLKVIKGGPCPYAGYYRVNTQFFWDKQSSSNPRAFYPYASVGFKSNINNDVFDYGGANTNYCRGSTFVTWSDGVKISYANALSNFMKTFGILLFTIFGMAVFMWFLTARPKTFSEAKQKLLDGRKKEPSIEEEFDFRKIQTGGNRDLVDF